MLPWDSPGKNTGVDCCSLFEGIFPTQGLNPGLLHCRQILYCLNQQRSPELGNGLLIQFLMSLKCEIGSHPPKYGYGQVAQVIKKICLPMQERQAGDRGSISGLGRSPGEENGNPLQYSCLGNPMDRGV